MSAAWAGTRRIEAADEVGVGRRRAATRRPSAWAWRRRRSSERSSGGGCVRRMPVPARSMSCRGRHPGEQRDLRVVVLGRRAARGSATVHDPSSRTTSCSGTLELHAAARELDRHAPLPDLAQQRARASAGHVGVGVLRDAADLRRGRRRWRRGRPAPSRSSVHSTAGRHCAGQQAGGALRQRGRVQRRLRVGRVDGDAARVGLGVERAAGRDEGARRRRSRSGRGARRRGARCAAPGRGRATPAGRWSRTGGRRDRPSRDVRDGARVRLDLAPAGTRRGRRPRGGSPRTPRAAPPRAALGRGGRASTERSRGARGSAPCRGGRASTLRPGWGGRAAA